MSRLLWKSGISSNELSRKLEMRQKTCWIFRLVREKSEKKGRNFPQLHRTIMLFKVCLRGIHHSVSHLQPYIDEYTYRFNRHKMNERIFENLLTAMVRCFIV